MSSYSIQQWTISRSDSDVQWSVDFICQLAMTSAVVRPRRSSKVLPKTKLAPKKVVVTVWWSDAHCQIHSSFPNADETIRSERYAQQINEMPWKLQCLQPALVNRKGPVLLYNIAQPHITRPVLQKLNELGYKILHHLPYSPDFSLIVFKHLDKFLQGKCLRNQLEAENDFWELLKFWSTDFDAIGINKLISHWQKCVDCNDSYFD